MKNLKGVEMSEERGSQVIPKAPVPRQVRMSILPKPPEPVAKVDEDGIPIPLEEQHLAPGGIESNDELAKKLVSEAEGKPKGTIFIKIYENMPYEVDFTGIVTGSEVDMAWRAMMKQYRVWKHTLFNKSKIESEGA